MEPLEKRALAKRFGGADVPEDDAEAGVVLRDVGREEVRGQLHVVVDDDDDAPLGGTHAAVTRGGLPGVRLLENAHREWERVRLDGSTRGCLRPVVDEDDFELAGGKILPREIAQELHEKLVPVIGGDHHGDLRHRPQYTARGTRGSWYS